ncbi:MAG: quinone-dependent dihydroorotate dehydrogenase [Fimbriimonadaceae bacterium]|nr:quinone-dependent dihydroorotate dehydrogenase [Fimbriimonadaceae bacterium]
MNLYADVLRPLAFRKDPEWVHERAMEVISRGFASGRWLVGDIPHDARLSQSIAGIPFPNPIGLAAGFDKDGRAVNHWHRFGFGFAEIGTVTAHGQPGNECPRLFRLPDDRALINRMGFNNSGAEAMAARLAEAFPKIPIGINLGKSKVTELSEAPADYAASMARLRAYGAYFVINVSSPNTPGLRALQEKTALAEIISAIREVEPDKPLFVKVSPDLGWGDLDDVVEVAHAHRLTGIIATNTTLSRERLREDPNQAGGLSGAPLRERADAVLAHLYRECDRRMILVGVGGVMTPEDALRKIELGAHLVQTYTGWVYGGPGWTGQVLRHLLDRLNEEQVSLSDLRGRATRTTSPRD